VLVLRQLCIWLLWPLVWLRHQRPSWLLLLLVWLLLLAADIISLGLSAIGFGPCTS